MLKFICLFLSLTLPCAAIASLENQSIKLRPQKKRLQITKNVFNPNSLTIELLGRGLIYSLNYDRMLGRHVSMGGGFSHLSLTADAGLGKGEVAVTSLPLYTNFYYSQNRHKIFNTIGVNIVKITTSIKTDAISELSKIEGLQSLPIDLKTGASITLPVPTAGLGYEYRNPFGVLIRTTAYVLLFGGTPAPWLGAAFGSNF